MVEGEMTREGTRQPWKAAVAATGALTLLVAACLVTTSTYDPQAIALMSEARVRSSSRWRT